MSQPPPPLELLAAHALHTAFITNKDILLNADVPPLRTVPKGTVLHVDNIILFAGDSAFDAFLVECAVRFDPEGSFEPRGPHEDHWYMPIMFLVDDCEALDPI